MKRAAYQDEGPNRKRQRHTDEEVTFLIPSKVAGSIIGKGGTNISKLRNQSRVPALQRVLVAGPAPPTPLPRTRRPATQYKASITVPDCPGPERVLSITTPDIETVLEILKEILPNLADAGHGGSKGDDLDVRLLIHQSRAGCVIGKAGSKIKELREKTGARLKIFSSPAPQSTERVVQLVGSPNSIVDGVREVLDLIQQVPIKGGIQNYDPHNYDDFYADDYGGFGLTQGGPSRTNGPRGGPSPRGSGSRGPPIGRGGSRPPMSRGPPGPRAGFGDFGGPSRGGFNGPPRGGNFGGGFSGRNSGGNFNNSSQQDTTTQVTIPTDLAGAIIGQGGSRIRKIRAESCARIEIAEPLPGASDRVITIGGCPQHIQMAQYLLQQSVHESNMNHGGRGNF